MSDLVAEVSCRHCALSPHEARVLVDSVVSGGVERKHLRWSMGRMARRSLQKYVEMVGSGEKVRGDAVFGGGEETGLFLGIPYVVSGEVPDGTVWLRRVEVEVTVGRLTDVVVEV